MNVTDQCQAARRCNQTVFLLHGRVYNRRQKGGCLMRSLVMSLMGTPCLKKTVPVLFFE